MDEIYGATRRTASRTARSTRSPEAPIVRARRGAGNDRKWAPDRPQTCEEVSFIPEGATFRPRSTFASLRHEPAVHPPSQTAIMSRAMRTIAHSMALAFHPGGNSSEAGTERNRTKLIGNLPAF